MSSSLAEPPTLHFQERSQKAQESEILHGYVPSTPVLLHKDSPRRTQVTAPKLRLSLPSSPALV
jgi:hypothetical protein